MKAVVLAGGLGLRLRERVSNLPKVMAPVAGRPFLEYVLDRLIAGGVMDVILSVGYRAEAVRDHFGDTYRSATLDYAVEAEPLGTGGAILHALQGEGDEPAIVVNGDTYTDIDYAELIDWYRKEPVRLAVVLRTVRDASRYGSVLVHDDRVTGFLEKGKAGPGLINAGIYLVRPEVFGDFNLSGKFSLEMDLLQAHCGGLKPKAFVTDGYFIDIGVPEDFDRAQSEFLNIT